MTVNEIEQKYDSLPPSSVIALGEANEVLDQTQEALDKILDIMTQPINIGEMELGMRLAEQGAKRIRQLNKKHLRLGWR